MAMKTLEIPPCERCGEPAMVVQAVGADGEVRETWAGKQCCACRRAVLLDHTMDFGLKMDALMMRSYTVKP